MNDFDRAEMKHDLDKAMNYYDECDKYCECDLCAEIETDEEEE